VYGVVTDNPAIAFKDLASKGKYSVVTQGKAVVRVSSINGNIKVGDLVTTSSIPGVGQKATENGYVIGVADEEYINKDTKKEGTIFVTLHLNFGMVSTTVRENLIASIKNGARAPFTSPLNALRYLTAGVIAILSFAGGFWFFGRVSSHGVEAIGRNPLARRFILISVGLNVLTTLAVMGLGVALAYLILVI
jgi:F0F1-type ATP synthase membrane subunit c/vacuolar-type H+-ATPase subunit K